MYLQLLICTFLYIPKTRPPFTFFYFFDFLSLHIRLNNLQWYDILLFWWFSRNLICVILKCIFLILRISHLWGIHTDFTHFTGFYNSLNRHKSTTFPYHFHNFCLRRSQLFKFHSFHSFTPCTTFVYSFPFYFILSSFNLPSSVRTWYSLFFRFAIC